MWAAPLVAGDSEEEPEWTMATTVARGTPPRGEITTSTPLSRTFGREADTERLPFPAAADAGAGALADTDADPAKPNVAERARARIVETITGHLLTGREFYSG